MPRQLIVIVIFISQLHHRRYSRSVETEDPESIVDSYVVGVVEFRPEPSDIDVRSRTGQHLDAYAELVRSDNAKVSMVSSDIQEPGNYSQFLTTLTSPAGRRHHRFPGTHPKHLLGLSVRPEPQRRCDSL